MKPSILLLAFLLSGPAALAQAVNSKTEEADLSAFDVMPARGGMLSNVVIDSQVTTATIGSFTRVNMHLSCYATNLRGVANPVSENSLIVAFIDVTDRNNNRRTISVQFPAEFVKASRERSPGMWVPSPNSLVTVSDPAASISAYDNVLQILIPNLKEMTLTSEGEVTNVTEKNMIFSGIRFVQRAPPGGNLIGSYFGAQGPLSSRLVWYTSVDGKTIDVYADFPGAATPGMRARVQGEYRTGFCGSYYSPLMLFFDEELPSFSGTSKFSLKKNQVGEVYWPEAYSPGHFLALDEKGDGKITNGSQLFGDYDGHDNGFAHLATYDSNKDGVIDKKDKVWKKLRLWNDENGDGISQKKEVIKLDSKDVVSINLKYIDETKKFGNRAEYKQRSTFEFKEKGKIRTGKVLDLWFGPAPIKVEGGSK